jgi:hypothetical protein
MIAELSVYAIHSFTEGVIPLGLTEGIKHQKASTCTYFHL